MFKIFIRPVLFLLPAETAHHVTVKLLDFMLLIPGVKFIFGKLYCIDDPMLAVTKKGLCFKNPVGLAAGFDKNATLFKSFRHLGFGYIEVGTVTPLPQPGNPKPRLFRLPKDHALINRMGFNNEGVKAMKKRLEGRATDFIIGGNIGKNKITANEDAANDYLQCFRELQPVVDYFVVNVSSPNTPGLRALQEKEPLTKLLLSVKKLAAEMHSTQPILLKIAPDLNSDELNDIIEIVKTTEIDGVIATNTTISREGLKSSQHEIKKSGEGGLSGKPLKSRSTEVIKFLRDKLGNEPLIIGVGGIETPGDAIEKLNAGADLLQLYTGFIYSGPSLIKQINKKIIQGK